MRKRNRRLEVDELGVRLVENNWVDLDEHYGCYSDEILAEVTWLGAFVDMKGSSHA